MNIENPIPPPQLAGPCAECGQFLPADDMVQLLGVWVCARCKPIFMQRLREGLPVGTSARMWRDGNALVVMRDVEPPPRCAKCNSMVSRPPIKRTLYWHSPWLYLLILVSLLIYVIVALIVRKKAVVFVPVCDEHRRQRIIFIIVSWTFVLASLGCFAGAIAFAKGELALVSIGSLLAGAILGVWKGSLVSAKKMEADYIWVGGYCPAFLASLPQWPKPS